MLKSAVQGARFGEDQELSPIKRLDNEARRLQGVATGAPLDELVARDTERSYSHGGRSGWEPPRAAGVAVDGSARRRRG